MTSVSSVYWGFLAFLVLLTLRRWFRSKSRGPVPPGPPAWPIIGNVLQWPKSREWLTFTEWGQKYGPVVYAHLLSQPFIILNSATAVNDLLVKRSANYSDRPHIPMLHDIIEFGTWNLPLMRYGDQWRSYRKDFHSSFRVSEVSALRPLLTETSEDLIKDLLDNPSEFAEHIRIHNNKIMLKVVYGCVQPTQDKFLPLLDGVFNDLNDKIIGKIFLVDIFPFLKHLPLGFPGAQFKRLGTAFKLRDKEIVNGLYDRVKTSMHEGQALPCVVTRALEARFQTSAGLSSKDENMVKHNAAASYGAGTDTTTSALTAFILAMTLYPDVQRRAKAEIDAVTSRQRLPEYGDRADLPYVDALVLESLRWNPAVPAGLPHSAVEDDVYEGYHIPAGSIVIGNVWAILHDPSMFTGPHTFKPERFLGLTPSRKQELEAQVMAAFGFGRRICPGRHLAMDSLWLSMARILASFDLFKEVDERGQEIEPTVRFKSGLTSHPEPFGCRFVSRSSIVSGASHDNKP